LFPSWTYLVWLLLFQESTSRVFPYGLIRITAASPSVAVANPIANAEATIRCIQASDADVVLLPELGLTGYTCGDLFGMDALLSATRRALRYVVQQTSACRSVNVVGLPLIVDQALMNVAAVFASGRLLGFVPKSFLPTYREFYEGRHFRAAAASDPPVVMFDDQPIPFGTDLLFQFGQALMAIEICEDLWTPIPPTSKAALAGANVLLNLSASNEVIGKAAWRRELVCSQSGRCLAAYAYASSGPGESTSDLVFGGHCLIAENGNLLAQSRRVGDGCEPAHVTETSVTCDVDLQRLAHDRQVIGTFVDGSNQLDRSFRVIDCELTDTAAHGQPRGKLLRSVDAHPFVPDESATLSERCAEIFAIQTAGLAKRLSRLPETLPLAIGISGGLDSTLALLVALRACDSLGHPRSRIHGITMPGFGTTAHTKANAEALIAETQISRECIDIRQLCLDTFRSLGHQPLGITIADSTTVDSLQSSLQQLPDDAKDLTFENIQARVRTMLLMSRGFVLGTGDMSEQALGWSTYNADHMSMYNVNTSIPKTLVRFLVRYSADHYFEGPACELLHRIADTPISPELLPPAADGSIRQDTEAAIGPYELHDFFLYHLVRHGCDREKILYLASQTTFTSSYSQATITKTLDTFLKRFFANQFKRNCVPDGPKVGSVSLSPRGDWRMPSDADVDIF